MTPHFFLTYVAPLVVLGHALAIYAIIRIASGRFRKRERHLEEIARSSPQQDDKTEDTGA